jgi:hypothetical protein
MQRKEHLMQELVREQARPDALPPRRLPKRRRRAAVLILVPAAVIALAAATYALISPSPDQVVDAIGCYEKADFSGSVVVLSHDTGGGGTEQIDGRDPVEICSEVWARGDIVPGSAEVPPLVACVPEGGGVVDVVPGDIGTCEQLGMAPLPAGYSDAAARVAAAVDEVTTTFESQCPGDQTAVDLARQALDAHGLSDWSVETTTSESMSCPVASVESEHRVLKVILPGPEGQPGDAPATQAPGLSTATAGP